MQSVQYGSDGLVYRYEQWSWVSRSLDPSIFETLSECIGAGWTKGTLPEPIFGYFWNLLENKWIYVIISTDKTFIQFKVG